MIRFLKIKPNDSIESRCLERPFRTKPLCVNYINLIIKDKKPGVVLDFDSKGGIVAIEILNASKKMPQPTKFEYEIA